MGLIKIVQGLYAESVEKNAEDFASVASLFSQDTSTQNFFKLKLALERIERDIAVRDALRSQIGAFS